MGYSLVIVIHDLEIRVGARALLTTPGRQLRVRPGDRIRLVGWDDAGKTMTMRILSGETEPYGGPVAHSGPIGYLPQNSREGNTDISARDRAPSAQGLDQIRRSMNRRQGVMETAATDTRRDIAIRRSPRLEEHYHGLDGYKANTEAARIYDTLGLLERVPDQPLRVLSGGQRHRVELVQVLFAATGGSGKSAITLLLDESTNHLDADLATWSHEFFSKHEGGSIMISHDVELLETMYNKVWFLDAMRAEADMYNMGQKNYLSTHVTSEARRHYEFTNMEKKAGVLRKQTEKLGAKAAKARVVKQMMAHAEHMMDSLDGVCITNKAAYIPLPEPALCGRTPLNATGLIKMYGSSEVFAGVDLAIDKDSRVVVLGLNGAGRTTLLKLLADVECTDGEGGIVSGHGLHIGYLAQEHDTIDPDRTVWGNTVYVCPDVNEPELRSLLGAFMFSGDKLQQPTGTLSGGKKTRLALAMLVSFRANVLLLDEPTNSPDPQSREQIPDVLCTYTGTIILVTHDPGTIKALESGCVIMFPDGMEDLWSDNYMEIVKLAQDGSIGPGR